MFKVLALCVVVLAYAVGEVSAGIADGGVETVSGVNPLISGGRATPAQDVPWHGGIFMMDKISNEREFLCGASLIAPDLLVTAAHCFWADRPIQASKYNVSVGSIYSSWVHSSNTALAQLRGVKRVVLHPQYRDVARLYEYDIAVLQLTSPVQLAVNVQPAHLDLDGSLQPVLEAGAQGVVAGWGLTGTSTTPSEVLRSIRLPYVDIDKCFDATPAAAQLYVTGRKFCAGYVDSDRSVCRGDSGGGFVVLDPATNRRVLAGVVSTDLQPAGSARQDTCYNKHYTAFTKVADQDILRWIAREFPAGSPPTCLAFMSTSSIVVKNCQHDYVQVDCSPVMPTGTVTVLGCPEGHKFPDGRATTHVTCLNSGRWSKQTISCVQGSPPTCPAFMSTSSIVVKNCQHDYVQVDCSPVIPTGTVTVLGCPEGYKFPDGRATTHVTCSNTGRWSKQTISCVQEIRCPPLASTPGQQIVCTLDDDEVDCRAPGRVGTTAALVCDRDFVLTIQAGQRRITTCQEEGSWSRTLALCLPQPEEECGRQSVSSTLLVKGETVVAGQLPWHVYIYGLNNAAGTLISATHVVTGAWRVSAGDSNTPRPASDLTLKAGQRMRDSTPADEPLQQTRGVRSVLIHPQFSGGYGGAHDIALLVADAGFVVTPPVNVACVDWSGLFPAPTTSDVIIVAAMNQGTVNTARRVTAAQRYTPVARQQCRARAHADRRYRFTDDKFCGETTGSDTCEEYRGAGLSVERATSGGRQYYLTGVLSVTLAYTSSDVCVHGRLIGFTDVTQNNSWLKQHVSPPT